MLENVHNKKFLKMLAEVGSMSDFGDLFAERLIRIAIASFPLIVRTKPLSRGATAERLFSPVLRNIVFISKGRGRMREGKRVRKRERDVTMPFCTSSVNQTVPDTRVGFKSNPRGGPVLL